MARVLLTNAYFHRLDRKQWQDARPYPPLGTLLAAAVLREAGHAVHVHDSGLARGPEDLLPALEAHAPRVLVIQDDGFNYLTKMCLTVMREACLRMIGLGKQQGCLVVVNSSDASDHPELYLKAGADAVVLGESEEALRELVEHWSAGTPWRSVANVAHLGPDGDVQRTPKRPVMRDLDALPLPAWDLIDLAPYRRIWMRSQGRFSLNVATTRGCPFKCNWCAKPIYGNRYNSRSPEHVVLEMELLGDRAAPDHLWMCDDIFGLKPGWVQRFADLVEERGVRIPYKIQSRVDLLLESDTIDALVRSGLEEVWVGAESGSQHILDAMDKGTRVEQIAEATRLLKAKGVRVGFFLQFGYPGESDADVERTIRMVEDLMPHDIGVSISYPLPGTPFFERVRPELGDKANWSDSDDLAMMFRGSRSPAYYKRLHRYVHARYRRRQAVLALTQALRGGPTDLRRGFSLLYYQPAVLVNRIRLSAT
ncbi:MAG: B12-binding domain-containing radical SAM protein [Flavobacteriales bacterium]|jgi:anaerobic magnesium-protoporphyrin IX monomethyl ester cyclase|nr:B12-binding domain-containing radical SAM protein [Flavobacteriales bacterium]MBK7940815.1 B12-binding domain-containing radical SAM protein [Flavobacteriales bacterium]MBK9700766.1 B12-binding domain-containing radical SAM protein [Flavobacteriales bacterium]